MGYGDISALNADSKIPTPYIDRIANEGMTFTDAHTSSSVCTPSRYSILTGCYSWRTELKRGVLHSESDACLVSEGRLTAADVLKQAGYNTAMIGKWHLGWKWAARPGVEINCVKKRKLANSWIDIRKPIEAGPTTFGFDYFFGICGSLGMDPQVWVENETPLYDYWLEKEGQNGAVHLPEYTRLAVEYIDQQDADTPFFLFFSLTSPHAPIVPNAEFQGKSPLGKYGDFCIETDYRVGQVLKALDDKGFTENTVVLFTADNGSSAAKAKNIHLEDTFGHYSSYIYRGYKAAIWEGGHRVPFLVRWPKLIEAGSQHDSPVGVFDLIKTVADINQVKVPDDAGEDSISLLPAFRGEDLPADARQGLIHHSSDGYFAVRHGDWKMCFTSWAGGNDHGRKGKTRGKSKQKQKYQLYHIGEDAGEQNNLYGTMPEKEAELLSLLQGAVTLGRTTPGDVLQNDTNNDWEQLGGLIQ